MCVLFSLVGPNPKMKTIKFSLGYLALILVLTFNRPQPALACLGTANICIGANVCQKTMVLAKASPQTVLRPSFGPAFINIPATLFVQCSANNNCGNPCPGGPATPVSAQLTLSIYPYPCSSASSPLASSTISTAGGTMALPASSPTGAFTSYNLSSALPPLTFVDTYCVIGTTTVTFSDGAVLTQTGDTVICLVPPVPSAPGVPRLSLQLLTPPVVRKAPGDQTYISYRIVNNDPSNSVVLGSAAATSRQAAVRPQGGNEAQGVFSIAYPYGAGFPIAFSNNPSCLPLPQFPYFQPVISNTALPTLPPGASTTVNIGVRSYGQCASGSCSESTLVVQAIYPSDPFPRPVTVGGGASLFVDTTMPTTGCGTGINDCNNNSIPDAVDILQNHTSQDNNHNSVPDECESGGNFIQLAGPGVVTPQTVGPYQFIQVLIQGSASPQPITNVLANGIALTSSNGFTWTGLLRADTRPGPQTVNFLAQDATGRIATQVGIYGVISNLPPLSLQVADGNATVSWPANLEGPFTLQVKSNLTDSLWTDMLVTLQHSLTFPAAGQSFFFRVQASAIPDDPTDYQAGRLPTAQFYTNDVPSYWVNYGIPPLCRLSDLLASAGTDPTNAFDGLMKGFNQSMFDSAFSGGLLPLEFSNHISDLEMAGEPSGLALLNTFRLYVNELDTVVAQQGTNAPRAMVIMQMFHDVFPEAYNYPLLDSPQANKTVLRTIPTEPNLLDTHGTDNKTTNIVLTVPPIVPRPDNTNNSSHTPWNMITNPAVWDTTYNAACAAVATGASLAKLNPANFPADTTCQFWNAFSCLLGATPSGIGATPADVAAAYDALGYTCNTAYHGIFESAAQEAKAALDRGCDVTLSYRSPDGTMGHVEMVEHISLDPGNSSHATVDTLSWGQQASVDVNAGTFSGKSDGARYGAGGYLSGKGKAIFRYYCKK